VFKIAVEHHHHFFYPEPPTPDPGTLNLLKEVHAMTAKLLAAVAALTSTTELTVGKLDSIEAYVQGIPDVVAAAVTDALESANVDADMAADLIETARSRIESEVDQVLAAIDANDDSDGEVEEPEAPLEPGTEPA